MSHLIEKYPDGTGPFGASQSETGLLVRPGGWADQEPGSGVGTTYSDADGNWVGCAMGFVTGADDAGDADNTDNTEDDENDEDPDPDRQP